MRDDAGKVINELLVDIFNQILILEERYHRVHGVRLSMTEIHALESIQKSKSKMMRDVAEALRITQGTLTTTINRLSQKGYVLREQDENDRRVYRLRLTDKGEAVMEIHNQFHEAMSDRLLLHLQDREELIDSIAEINEFFKELYEIT
ncbi:MarR family transcriptional regulator [Erysipelothrix piscisicarius]|uniref:MarR family transcriptional regulator n=1 Tax=Erysipelothrix piscisicarius TaxID=2485784 RepID=A0A3Q8S319_9FIRM|nr:MarR family transcriptional regulator [Erysipelothrix piscisicarius]AZK44521.1 MarR family transcriptional regulator [Erysipelothrix piscisicarius]